MQPQRRRNNSWIGPVIFFLIIFGRQLLPPLTGWLTQVTGMAITTPMVITAVVGLIIVASVVSLIAQANQSEPPATPGMPGSKPTNLPRPTSPPPPRQAPSPSPQTIPSVRVDLPEPSLPPAPRFEPIIGPGLLAIGIIGLLLLGGLFFVALTMLGI